MAATAHEVTPNVALKQLLELADSLGYTLGVVALTPRTRTPVPVVEYLPDGVEIQLALIRKTTNDNHAGLPQT